MSALRRGEDKRVLTLRAETNVRAVDVVTFPRSGPDTQLLNCIGPQPLGARQGAPCWAAWSIALDTFPRQSSDGVWPGPTSQRRT